MSNTIDTNDESIIGGESSVDNEENTNDTLMCPICDFETKDPICMNDHTMIVHDGLFSNVYYCHRCGIEFIQRTDLDSHLVSCDEESDEDVNADTKQEEDTQLEAKSDDDSEIDNTIEHPPTSSYSETVLDRIQNIMNIRFDLPPLLPVPEIATRLESQQRIRRRAIASLNTNLETEASRSRRHSRLPTLSRYTCNICLRIFRSQYDLGEHFMNDHSSYDEQLLLDNIPKTAFPGFSVLSHINMIHIPISRRVLLKLSKEKCCVCCSDFSIYNYSLDKTRSNISAKYLDTLFDDVVKQTVLPYDINSYSKTKLHNDFKLININYPIIMTCCGNSVCHKCFRSSIINKNDIICLFCMKNHNKIELDYVKMIKPSRPDRKSWELWWKQNDHVSIFF